MRKNVTNKSHVDNNKSQASCPEIISFRFFKTIYQNLSLRQTETNKDN